MFKSKIILATMALLLGASGVAVAATGNVPEVVKNLMVSSVDPGVSGDQDTGQEISAAEDQYSGGGVSTVARDKSATGTKTLPNGKVIENHGLAVSQAARAQYHEEGNGEGDQPQAGTQEGEDNTGNQAETHENRGNGTSSAMPKVPAPRGGKHGKP